ncbi:MAG: hypothetical protein ACLS43_03315 [Evtepia gabavorous]
MAWEKDQISHRWKTSAAQGIRVSIFWLKHDGGFKVFHQAALPWNPELCGKGTMQSGDDFHGNGALHNTPSIVEKWEGFFP